jgi:uncharacterized membrane protein (UPF0127 family)
MEKIVSLIRENIRLILGLVVVIFFSILLASFIASDRNKPQVSVNNRKFQVALAKTEKDRQIGLSNTKSLPQNKGMLFLFDRADYYAFWMNQMKFPIDIIYIHGDKVTTVIANAPTPSQNSGNLPLYHPKDPSDKVLEVNAGIAKKYNIQEGSVVTLKNL